MIKIKQSKLIINIGIVLSLLTSIYILFFQELVCHKNIYVQLLFYLALLSYQIRYFYLINYTKKHRVTFQLIERQKNPILLDTFVGLFLFCILPIILSFVNKEFNSSFNWIDVIAFVIYLLGTIITLISENQRRKWKINNPKNLYQGGLFKYANHINYFGETLSFPAYCWLATGSTIVFMLILIHQIVDFVFIQIPKQEKYLNDKYPMDFPKIANKKKMIPFIY